MVLIQKSSLNKDPIFCPVCNFAMSAKEDYIYYKTYKACKSCSVKYAEGNKAKWFSGWRPTKKEIKNDIR